MFVQVIRGRTHDADALRAELERWAEELRPGAVGFLGSTSGTGDDGTFVLVARFADEASARANADRSEQGAWYEQASKLFDGEPTFRESSDVKTLLDGGSDRAGFVQVMEGRVTDRARAEAMETPEMLAQLRKARPDLIGSFRIMFGNAFVDLAYFTSEEAARAGEQSADFEGPGAEFAELFGEMTFLDLHDPLMVGPAG